VATSGEQPGARRPAVEPYVPEHYAFEPPREQTPGLPPDGTTPAAHRMPEAPVASQFAPQPTSAPRRPATPAAGLPGPLPTPAPLTVPRTGHREPPTQPTPAQPPAPFAGGAADAGAYERATTEQRLAPGDLDLNTVLAELVRRGGSDLHLTAGNPPTLRLHGELTPMEEYETLTPHVIQRVMYSVITQKQRERFEEQLELDFAYAVPDVARFRVNVYRQREALGAAFRLIPYEIKPLEDLGVPPAVANLAGLARGMVLVTGPTGSGKSTTLASLLDLANRTRRDHIMTVEDPIEFLHHHKLCLVNQREVGEDTHSFANALKHVLRQDPDIILVGEMRDLETISVALTAAETGHLVFATLHTQDAAQTIDRVIDVFPPHQQQQVRVQLAATLQGVVCQTLCRRADGRGRVVATEVMFATPAIRNLVREGKTHQVYSAMQSGAQHGMQTLDQHLGELVRTNRITFEHGLEKCHHVEDFKRLAGRA
jgi:twitching motility protein PilT